ncbi:hypothetical protein D1815_02645 [Aquimarina sp. AD1]|uniref:hypothetical protein n=1 Tax=Aquimarina sp. (strain AD1) TaxID=1714848 RepID=UPI000E48E5B9|nr:hypothetical protein [Aquimarina sp. AD1]AXT54703.1 hypothetical protein D1815_02645 [Aquimarina sp. AD1]RKN23185.1 hypothetical protein D7035_11750 [Aquimarina sp. AD1]
MRTFIEDQVAISILPISGIVNYHQKIHSEINCRNRLEQQKLTKDMEVQILECNPMFFTVKIVTKNIEMQLGSLLKKQENLTKEIYGILKSIEFRMNWKGELIEILNHREIIDTWKSYKPKLKERYRGQAVERYLIGVEKKILHHDKLISDCLQYRLYGLLFNDLFGYHSNDPKEAQSRTRVHGNMVYQLPLSIREKVLLQKEDDHNTLLSISGVLDKEQLYAAKIQNLFKRKNILDANTIKLTDYKGEYRYDKKMGVFDSVTLNIVTEYGENYRKIQNYQLKQEV